MSQPFNDPCQFARALEAEKQAEMAIYQQRTAEPHAVSTAHIQAANARDRAAAEHKALVKREAQRAAHAEYLQKKAAEDKAKKAAEKALDDEWEMVNEEEDWDVVTKEEADDKQEMISASGSRISILDSGLQ